MRAEFTAKQEEPNNFCLELQSPAALRFEMSRLEKKIAVAIKRCHPRGPFLLLAVLLYAFATFYHTSLILKQGTKAKREDLESVILITQAIRFVAVLVMFIVILICLVDPDEERPLVFDGETRGENIYDRTIP